MKKYLQCFQDFCKNKGYVLILALTAICAYGFMVTHPTVGIDDTPFSYYFEEGLAAIVGRWVMFLLNKVVHVSDFAPLITDFTGVLLLMLAVTVWAVLFRSVLEDAGASIPWYGYLFFATVFLSCPLISEVYTYYLHNGIATGYLCCGISLCCFREGLIRLEERTEKKGFPGLPVWKAFAGAVVGLWIALGCYESFMIVWIQGLCLVLLTERFVGVSRKVFRALCIGAVSSVLAVVMRSVMINLVTAVFQLEHLENDAVRRFVGELTTWIFEPGAMSELAMVLKRMFVMYGVFAYAYLPVRIFLLAAVTIGLFSIWRAVKGKDLWTLLLVLGGLAVPLLLVVIECKATYYRSAQFLPVVCGYGVLVLFYVICNLRREKVAAVGRKVLIAVMCILLWNQCVDMNKWFYVDYMKYESAKELAGEIYWELERGYDTGKPVVFTGGYEVPVSIIKDAYVPYGTETFYKMKRITDMVDEHLLEKFYRSDGVWVAQTPVLSVIDWAANAFGTNEEMETFFEMHGYSITPLLDKEIYPQAEQYAVDLPGFPMEGAIVDMGNYIIVNLR